MSYALCSLGVAAAGNVAELAPVHSLPLSLSVNEVQQATHDVGLNLESRKPNIGQQQQ
jgi:hypothetical protein